MSAKHSGRSVGSRSVGRVVISGTMIGLTLMLPSESRASAHLWNIREVYTDATGTNQFIEFFTSSGNQQFVGGRQIRIVNVGNTMTNVFTIPSNLPGDSANKAFLIGTVGITNFGAPRPDYIIPSNFVFPEGGTITFFGLNSGSYTALPTDGTMSRTWGDGNAVNSPQNFAGQTGTISFPNTPPSVSITNPPNNELFAKPVSVVVGVSASDPGGSVANVQLFVNGALTATDSVAPFSFTLTNLGVGNYALRARAVDNQSLAATSAPVNIRVVTQPILSALPGSNGPVRFLFGSLTNATYVIERATPLTNFSAIATNPGTGGTLQFEDTNGPVQQTYRVRLQ